MLKPTWLAGIGLIVAIGGSVAAQRLDNFPVSQASPGLKFKEVWRPASAVGADTKIVGTVIDIRQIPVAKVKVQLRNLSTGAVVAELETDENGEYSFDIVDAGTYVVEMLMADGSIMALSNAGSLSLYETLQTVVQLPGRWDSGMRSVVMQQNMASFAGLSSALSMTATTMTLAIGQNVPPVNSGEPASPQ